MRYMIPQLYMTLHNLTKSEEGQDLVEYALVVCLIALASITGANQVATAITTVFSNISSSLA
jgi:pilus assembly protein Flp/PilA